MQEGSIICAQGNKTLYYDNNLKILYVFGIRDNSNLYLINGSKQTEIKPFQSIAHTYAHLYNIITDSLYLVANGPNCTIFGNKSNYDNYFFGSNLYARIFMSIPSYNWPHYSCSRTHIAVLHGHPDPDEGEPYWLLVINTDPDSQQTSHDDIKEAFRLPTSEDDSYEIFCGNNCTFFLHEDGRIFQIMLHKYLQQKGYSCPILPEKFNNEIPEDQPKPKKIVSGDEHVMILYDDGTFDGFGTNSQGQIPSNSHSAFKREGGYKIGVKDIACGNKHTLFLLDNGKVVGFGSDTYGQDKSYFPRPDDRVYQIACGNEHSLALLSNDMIGWGRNEENQLGKMYFIIRSNLLYYNISNFAKSLLKKQQSKGGSKKNSQYIKKISKKLKIKN